MSYIRISGILLRFLGVCIVSFTLLFCGPGQIQAAVEKSSVRTTGGKWIKPEIRTKLRKLQEEIEKKKHSFTVGYNPAMEAPLKGLCGLVEPEGWKEYAPFVQVNAYLTALPGAFDWRDLDGVTPIKNQKSCGGCWAFATAALLESKIKMQCGITQDISEQYLVSCNTNRWGCNGGWWAHNYHIDYAPAGEREAGGVLESNFPYQAADASCGGPYAHPYKLASWSYIAGSGVPSVSAIKQAMVDHGPIATAVCVGSKFQAYRSGIFDADEAVSCSGGVNHAVVLVGWNDDRGTNDGYWILKNSWGTGWGETGYMRIRYGKSKVGYAANFVDFPGCSNESRLDCATAVNLFAGDVYSGTTIGAPAKVGTYSCSGTKNEIGPERVHRITTTGYGDLKATLGNLSTDLDVFILKACDPGSCVAYGDNSATYSNAPPGTYYIVVDGPGSSGGSYNLSVGSAEKTADLTGNWSNFRSYYSGKRISATFGVTNSGTLDAGSFKVAFYLSSDGKTAERLIKTTSIYSLKAKQTSSISFRYSSSISVSGKYIVVKIDSSEQVAESDEANNSVSIAVP